MDWDIGEVNDKVRYMLMLMRRRMMKIMSNKEKKHQKY